MRLFPYPLATDPGYVAQRHVMEAWIVATCGCGLGRAQQVLTDVENHNGQPNGGGITALTVTITAGQARSTITPAQAGGPFTVFHHSHGIIGTNDTCTGFWIVQPGGLGIAKFVALGIHRTANTYQIEWIAGAGFTFANTGGGAVPTVGATINPF